MEPIKKAAPAAISSPVPAPETHHVPVAAGLVVGSPVLGTPALGQRHALKAAGLESPPPVALLPFGQAHALDAASLTVKPPDFKFVAPPTVQRLYLPDEPRPGHPPSVPPERLCALQAELEVWMVGCTAPGEQWPTLDDAAGFIWMERLTEGERATVKSSTIVSTVVRPVRLRLGIQGRGSRR